jgi:hypothetical protein
MTASAGSEGAKYLPAVRDKRMTHENLVCSIGISMIATLPPRSYMKEHPPVMPIGATASITGTFMYGDDTVHQIDAGASKGPTSIPVADIRSCHCRLAEREPRMDPVRAVNLRWLDVIGQGHYEITMITTKGHPRYSPRHSHGRAAPRTR